MAVTDIDARFDHVQADGGTLAHSIREEMRAAAHRIDELAGPGEDPSVTAVVQQMEMAAHTASRLLNRPAGSSEDRDLSQEELKALARERGLPVSGSKAELRERIQAHDGDD